jgi:hypothetical protein
MSNNQQASTVEAQRGSFDLINRARMFSDRSCRKKSTGNPSRRSLVRFSVAR